MNRHPSSSSSMVLMGQIVAPHGIKGGLKIKSFCESLESFSSFPSFYDEKGKEYQIRIERPLTETTLLGFLSEVKDRNQAEAMRGVRLYVPKEDLPELEDDVFYYNDLINMDVFTQEGVCIGQVNQINNYGAGDILEIKGLDGKSYSIIFTKEAVPEILLKDNKIIVVESFIL